MNQALAFIQRFDRRQLLLGAAALLLLLNLGQWGLDFLVARQAELADRSTMLDHYREAVARRPEVEARVAQLRQQRDRLESYLFHGESEEQVVSAMQIMLQTEISEAGMEPEFIQPVRSGPPADQRGRGEIVINIRMAGTLNGLGRFLHARYKSPSFFRVSNLTLKPYKTGELKVSMEVRGYYRLGKAGGAPP
ncbi:MAG: type II secretion system protein GspM [Thermodesulfobacteriota bacterium]